MEDKSWRTSLYNLSSFFRVQKSIQVLILVAITNWIAHFWNYKTFGLYEDDWYRVPLAITMTFSELGSFIIHSFTDLGFSQGRPLHPALILSFSLLAAKLGEMHFAYVFGYLILTVNTFLFYLLLRKLFENHEFALLGALAFSLFPADTTQKFLTHSLGVQPSLTFLLIAFHCYIANQKIISYSVVFLCLLCYETAFPVFFLAPLLQEKWDKKSIKTLARHTVIMAIMLITVIVARRTSGESNITGSGLHSVLFLFGNPIVGPITALSMFIYRPITGLLALQKEWWGLLLFGFGCLGWGLSQESFRKLGSMPCKDLAITSRVWGINKIPEAYRDFTKPLLLGLMFLILAYPFTLTTLGFSLSGRGTRVHAVAVLGASILFACVASIIIRWAQTYSRRRLAIWGVAGYLTLLLGFGLTVQQDYKLSWEHQRAFWTDAIALIPDMTNETVILIEPTGLRDSRQLLFLRKDLTGTPDSRQIKSLDFLYVVLPKLFDFPRSWQRPPRIYRLPKNWQEAIVSSQQDFLQTISIEEDWSMLVEGVPNRSVNSSQVIFLETKNGKLTRRTEPLILGGKVFKLKAPSTLETSTFKKTAIYDYVIRQPNSPAVKYLLP